MTDRGADSDEIGRCPPLSLDGAADPGGPTYPDACDAVVEVDQTGRAGWDSIAAEFADVSYEQTSAFADAKWGAERASTVAVWKKGRPVACARLVVLRPPLLSSGLAYLKFGPLWRPRGQPADPAALRHILATLVDEYCVRRGYMLTVLPRPMPEGDSCERGALLALGFRQRPPAADTTRYLVDVSLDRQAQLASLGQKWRYNLRRALKQGIDVACVNIEAGIKDFDAMHGAMVLRKNYPDHEAVGLRLLAMSGSLPQALRPVLVLATKNGRALAGAVIGRTGDVPVYLFGASRDEALKFNAGYVLQWWIVDWLRSQGDRWYDLGGNATDPRLEQFKRGLVGKAGRLVAMPSEYDFWTSATAWLGGQLIFKARDMKRLTYAAFRRR